MPALATSSESGRQSKDLDQREATAKRHWNLQREDSDRRETTAKHGGSPSKDLDQRDTESGAEGDAEVGRAEIGPPR
jgi:hypothetical protein